MLIAWVKCRVESIASHKVAHRACAIPSPGYGYRKGYGHTNKVNPFLPFHKPLHPSQGRKLKGNVGEEWGLLGSEQYTDHSIFPIGQYTITDLNIDRIGAVWAKNT